MAETLIRKQKIRPGKTERLREWITEMKAEAEADSQAYKISGQRKASTRFRCLSSTLRMGTTLSGISKQIRWSNSSKLDRRQHTPYTMSKTR